MGDAAREDWTLGPEQDFAHARVHAIGADHAVGRDPAAVGKGEFDVADARGTMSRSFY